MQDYHKKSLYIASPLGFSEAGRFFLNEKLKPEIASIGYDVLDPFEQVDSQELGRILSMPYGPERLAAWEDLNPRIGKCNDIALQTTDGVFAVLDGVDVDSGTASEIGAASIMGKPILGYRGDFRLARDNEAGLVNLQVEYFIGRNRGKIIQATSEIRSACLEIFGNPEFTRNEKIRSMMGGQLPRR